MPIESRILFVPLAADAGGEEFGHGFESGLITTMRLQQTVPGQIRPLDWAAADI